MQRKIVLLIGAALMGLAGCAQLRVVETDSETARVQQTVEQFNHIWETKDFDTFSRIMAHDADMVVYGSDAPEHWVGWKALEEAVRQMLPVLDNVTVTVREQTIKLHRDGEVAWFSEIWDWDYSIEGNPVHSEGQRLTGVLEKRKGAWVIVQIHNSVPVVI